MKPTDFNLRINKGQYEDKDYTILDIWMHGGEVRFTIEGRNGYVYLYRTLRQRRIWGNRWWKFTNKEKKAFKEAIMLNKLK